LDDNDAGKCGATSTSLPPFLFLLFLPPPCTAPCCERASARNSLAKHFFFPDTGCMPPSRPCSDLLLACLPQQSSPPAATGALRLPLAETSDVEGSEGALSNSECMFGLPVIGGIGSLLPRHAGVRARSALERDAGQSSVSVSSSSSSSSSSAVQTNPVYIMLYAGVRS
jgi:hypothetical protein